MYKLIAVDMDGTLLRPDHTISARTKKMIQKAREQGTRVVLASGRPLEGMEGYLKELNMISDEDYVLAFNGAIVQNTKTKEIIKRNTLAGADLHYLYDLSKQLGVNIHAFSKEGCITPKASKYTEYECAANKIPMQIVDYGAIGDDEDIIKVLMVDEPEILEKAIQKLPSEVYKRYTVVQSAPFFLEFLNKKANKGEGVKALAKHLQIHSKEIICIGDAGNDIDMLQFAGLGVAMGNAFEEVKEVADYITKSNEEDGVASVIEKFVVA